LNTYGNADRLLKNFPKDPQDPQQVWAFGKILDRLEGQLTFLSDAGKILSSSLDLKKTFSNLVRLIVPYLADWTTISLVTKDKKIVRLAMAHVDPKKEISLRRLIQEFPARLEANLGVPLVIRTGEPEFVEKLKKSPESYFSDYFEDKRQVGIFSELGCQTYMTIPMKLRDQQVIGAIWFSRGSPDQLYSKEEFHLAQDLTTMATQAVYNSLAYEQAISAAEKLRVERCIKEESIGRQIEDIKTPLTAISLMVQLLPTMSNDRKKQEIFKNKVVEHIQKVVKLINHLSYTSPSNCMVEENLLDKFENILPVAEFD
jgi:hypothetical protein